MLKAYETSGNVLFEEKQRFPQWLTILMAGIILFTIVIVLVVGYTVPGKNRNDMWIGLAVAIPVELLTIILFRNVRLEKIVTTNGLYYRWKPWQKRFSVIEKESIKTCEVRQGPPFNYGFGWFPGYGRFHNASRGEGLQLYLVNGEKIYFSTFDSIFFKMALENLISSNTKRNISEF